MEYIFNFQQGRYAERDCNFFSNSRGGIIPIFNITSFHTLTQFVGYGKYINRNFGNVYFRGQTTLYPEGLKPSLLRTQSSPARKISIFLRMQRELAQKSKDFGFYEPQILSPLLQHYGFKTQWLDLVDNLWVAIWFSLHNFDSFNCDGMQHVHISPQDNDTYAYIFLILVDATKEKEGLPGVYQGDNTTLVDLRKACPSLFLRPHAQHALMVKKTFSKNVFNYNDLVIGIAKIKTSDGFDWIGRNGLMSIQSLFPPTYYDYGYRMLLEQFKTSQEFFTEYGSIQLISY